MFHVVLSLFLYLRNMLYVHGFVRENLALRNLHTISLSPHSLLLYSSCVSSSLNFSSCLLESIAFFYEYCQDILCLQICLQLDTRHHFLTISDYVLAVLVPACLVLSHRFVQFT
jgi:hypothetical protein